MKEHIKQKLKRYYEEDKQYFENLDANFYSNKKSYTKFLHSRYFTGKKVLDAGCGSGAMTHWLSKTFTAEVTGIDLSPHAIRKARKKYKGTFVVGDIEHMPFANHFFDTVLLFDVLEH